MWGIHRKVNGEEEKERHEKKGGKVADTMKNSNVREARRLTMYRKRSRAAHSYNKHAMVR